MWVKSNNQDRDCLQCTTVRRIRVSSFAPPVTRFPTNYELPSALAATIAYWVKVKMCYCWAQFSMGVSYPILLEVTQEPFLSHSEWVRY